MALIHRFDDTTMCVKGATCVGTSGTVTIDGVNYTGNCSNTPDGDATRYCGDYQYMTNVNPFVPMPKCDCEQKKSYLLWILILLVIYYFKFY